MDAPTDSLRTALRLALRQVDHSTTTEQEHDAVLAAITEHLSGAEAEVSARTLFHRRQARQLQLELRGLLGGPNG